MESTAGPHSGGDPGRARAGRELPRIVSRVATRTLQCVLEAWYEELHAGDTVALIGVVLDGSDLTTDELRGFVQALPASLLQRIVDFPTPEASGLQALLAIEHQRRKKEAPDYTLSRDVADGKLIVSFRQLGETIEFKLDETFEGAPHPGVIP